jgi:hypothetical protein
MEDEAQIRKLYRDYWQYMIEKNATACEASWGRITRCAI